MSEKARAVKALARQHLEAIWAEHQTTSRLRSVLLEFYPQAMRAFPQLKHKAALPVLAAAPTPAKGLRMTPSRLVTLLHRCGRRNDPALVEQVLAALKTPALRQPPAVEDALAAEFADHALAPVLRSAPGLGPVLAARVLAEVGDDPRRFSSAQGCARSPGPRPSPAPRDGPGSSTHAGCGTSA